MDPFISLIMFIVGWQFWDKNNLKNFESEAFEILNFMDLSLNPRHPPSSGPSQGDWGPWHPKF